MDEFRSKGPLSDEAINEYFSWLRRKNLSDEGDILYFNTFFYVLLESRGFEAVRKWTTRMAVDLASKRLVVVPIHSVNHWCLVVLNIPERKIHYMDSLCVTDGLQACNTVLKYVRREVREKRSLKLGKFVAYEEDVPQQDNDFDCGAYICLYARALAFGEDINSQEYDRCRQRILEDLGS